MLAKISRRGGKGTLEGLSYDSFGNTLKKLLIGNVIRWRIFTVVAAHDVKTRIIAHNSKCETDREKAARFRLSKYQALDYIHKLLPKPMVLYLVMQCVINYSCSRP
jgi:hypothetical protein